MAAKPIVAGLIIAALLIGSALALKAAQRAGMVDADTVVRATQALMGLMVAFYGNAIPKQIGRSRGVAADRCTQKVLRVAGWTFTLAGLAYAVLAFVAPLSSPLPTLCMISAIAIGLGYAIRCYFSRTSAE